ncbi:hypothetical protein GCM10009549_37150 [Streptomyces thermoalcalitolerans]|uniref:histidine kinase n=1 Tax=Streptomyces thermoalcalitolerans TaxID=65605 RepID=A0ABN1NZH4_9ACTN
MTSDRTEAVDTVPGDRELRQLLAGLTAVRDGDFGTRLPEDADGLMGDIATVFNGMVDQLSVFTSEVTRVAREVGTEGRLGGQAKVPGVSGTWADLTDSVNAMAGNLTTQVRDIAQVATAVAKGDLSQKIDVDARGEILELKNTINTMVDTLSAFADEVTRVAREVGTEGRLGGQAKVEGVSGTWKDLTDNVNSMASNLTGQVRSIALVTTAVARGDLSQKIDVDARGEILELKTTINTMVDTLSAFADEVTRVAREVGTEGRLGGQAKVEGVSGTWKDLTDNVNSMASNLTGQVRSIAQVATAVARGDLSRKITVEAKGEVAALADVINTMVDTLSDFADEVTRVAREVGTEGRLGGQARVEGVSGTWKRLTENVNELAGNLTRQVRAIAEVASAVAEGDLTRSITVEASGEVAELKDNINSMVESLRETTRANQEQDWLKTNLARITSLMQGHRDLPVVAELIMEELTPLVSAQYGAFYLAEESEQGAQLRLVASYGRPDDDTRPTRFPFGRSLVGQAARSRRTITVDELPPDYVTISSGLGRAVPSSLILLPILFEDQVLGVIELAAVTPFKPIHRDFLEQLREALGVNVNTIMANARTDELLEESQRLTAELQARSAELQAQQEELRRSNAELEEKASLLAAQNRDIEAKNLQIEQARQELEARAQQLSQASKYKSEFLANMSHELRTPLNSLLILAQLLAQNPSRNLTPKQVEYAGIIHSAGSDLLQLINDILDLSKVEAGKMDVSPERVPLRQLIEYVEATFRPMTTQKGLEFAVTTAAGAPADLITDDSRLRQILRNLLSNAVKFTERGRVELRVEPAADDEIPQGVVRGGAVVAFRVKDTGIGIPEQHLETIFGAFQQADGTTSRKYGGTGLGLSITREIAHLLGGAVVVDSAPGRGSTFTLFLPVARPDFEQLLGSGHSPQKEPAELASAAPAALPGPRAADPGRRERGHGPGPARPGRRRRTARGGRRHRGGGAGGGGRAGRRTVPLRGSRPGHARGGGGAVPAGAPGRLGAGGRTGARAQRSPPGRGPGRGTAVVRGQRLPGVPVRPGRAARTRRPAPVGEGARGRAAPGPARGPAGSRASRRRRLPGPYRPRRRRRRAQSVRAQRDPGDVRLPGAARGERAQGHRDAARPPRCRAGADGRDDAGDGRVHGHGGDPQAAAVRRSAHHRRHRQGDAGRPREGPGRGCERLRHQACRRPRPDRLCPAPAERVSAPAPAPPAGRRGRPRAARPCPSVVQPRSLIAS